MPLFLPMRNIDYIVGEKARLVLDDGRELKGEGIFTLSMRLSDDTEEEADFLRFICYDGTEEYLLESDIKEYEILK